MNKILLNVISICFIITFSSCNETDPVSSKDDILKYLPLKVGVMWNYESLNTNMLHTKIEVDSIDRNNRITLKYTYLEFGIVTYYYWKKDSSGVEFYFSPEEHYYILKYPILKGQSWTDIYVNTQEKTLIRKSTIDSVGFIATVKAGVFNNCIKVVSTTTDEEGIELFTEYSVYAPDVGQILTDGVQLLNYSIPQ